MKFLLTWPAARFSTWDVANGISKALKDQGHVVEDYLLYRRLTLMGHAMEAELPEGKTINPYELSLLASESLPYRVITTRPDWVLVVNGIALHPNALWAIRSIGARIAIWFTEAPYDTVESRELGLAKFANIAFVNEVTSVGLFQDLMAQNGGGQAVYLPHAYDPGVHVPRNGEVKLEHDVVMVGSGFEDRVALLQAIDWTGIDLCLAGLWPGITEPQRMAKYVKYGCIDNEETARLYRSSRIGLNLHRHAPGAESANPRTYELAACGLFQICDRRAEVVRIFGDAVPTFEPGSALEAAVLIRHYLAPGMEGERERMAHRARELVAPHTFAVRAKTIVETLEKYER